MLRTGDADIDGVGFIVEAVLAGPPFFGPERLGEGPDHRHRGMGTLYKCPGIGRIGFALVIDAHRIERTSVDGRWKS